MRYPFVVRALKKLLRREEMISVRTRGADRFTEGRIPEIKRAIEVLNNDQPLAKPINPAKQAANQMKLFFKLFTPNPVHVFQS